MDGYNFSFFQNKYVDSWRDELDDHSDPILFLDQTFQNIIEKKYKATDEEINKALVAAEIVAFVLLGIQHGWEESGRKKLRAFIAWDWDNLLMNLPARLILSARRTLDILSTNFILHQMDVEEKLEAGKIFKSKEAGLEDYQNSEKYDNRQEKYEKWLEDVYLLEKRLHFS